MSNLPMSDVHRLFEVLRAVVKRLVVVFTLSFFALMVLSDIKSYLFGMGKLKGSEGFAEP